MSGNEEKNDNIEFLSGLEFLAKMQAIPTRGREGGKNE